jgi:hypothetical protein
MKFYWLKKVKEYFKNKELPEECGMVYKDRCDHQFVGNRIYSPDEEWKCKKCGEPYNGF